MYKITYTKTDIKPAPNRIVQYTKVLVFTDINSAVETTNQLKTDTTITNMFLIKHTNRHTEIIDMHNMR